MIKKLLPIFALCASSLYAADYLVAGVDKNDASTYYDFNKLFDGTDHNLCWAYSASNVLQWWQDKQDDYYISTNSIPDGKTYSDQYASDIVSTFVKAWGNEGGFEINGFTWWLSDVAGSPTGQLGDFDETLYFPEGGGYWSDFVDSTSFIGEERDMAIDDTYDQYFIETMDNAILAGNGMTLGIYLNEGEGGAHAITLWGYGEEDGKYWLYLTDSDDELDGMFTVDIEYNTTDELWYMQGYGASNDWFVGDVTTLAANVLNVPEPSTVSLCLLALAGLYHRRRKSV